MKQKTKPTIISLTKDGKPKIFVKPKITTLTLSNFKNKMIEAAKKAGKIWENFGQVELNDLKTKYNYEPYANRYNVKEYNVKTQIDAFDNWCMNFSLEDIK